MRSGRPGLHRDGARVVLVYTRRMLRALYCALCLSVVCRRRYAAVDKGFNVTGYMWVAAWFLIFSVDQVYIKHIVDTIQVPRVGRGTQGRPWCPGQAVGTPEQSPALRPRRPASAPHCLSSDWHGDLVPLPSPTSRGGRRLSGRSQVCRKPSGRNR